MVPIAWVAAVFSFTLALGLWKRGRGRGDGGNPELQEVKRQKKTQYLIASKYERIGWVGDS